MALTLHGPYKQVAALIKHTIGGLPVDLPALTANSSNPGLVTAQVVPNQSDPKLATLFVTRVNGNNSAGAVTIDIPSTNSGYHTSVDVNIEAAVLPPPPPDLLFVDETTQSDQMPF